MNVIKRDGSIQQFNFLKIVDAVTKAFNSVEQQVPDKFLEQLKESVEKAVIKNNGDGTSIEEIQDVIQKELIKRNKYEVVESFINYRRKREEIRQGKSDLIKEIEEKLSGKNIQNQNANLDEASFGGRIGEMASVVCKKQALKHMRKQSRMNHEKNEVYIHDLDAWEDGRHNCLTIPFDDLLAKGFTTRQTDVRPAGSVNTAMQLVAVIFQLQSLQQFGGVSASHLDWTMIPYVRKSFFKHFKDGLRYCEAYEGNFKLNQLPKNVSIESYEYKQYPKAYQYAMDMTEREVHQAVEGMYHNLNTLQSRSGNQLPFTSINYGTCTKVEGRMVTKALLDVSIEGLGKFGVTSIFPCGIFQCMKGVNMEEGEPNYDLFKLALKSTSQRLYPNYANVDWSVNKGYDVNDPRTYFSTMGCHAVNTPIVMADGTLKMVQNVNVGDKVMGADGTPRNVLSLIRGNDRMFKVEQSRSESYVVNEGHILALEYSVSRKYKNFKKGDKVNMSVHDFLELPDYVKRYFKGYKVSYIISDEKFVLTDKITYSTLKITEVEKADFYGFELDGDKLYLFNDCTVTHNCRTSNGVDINAESGQNPQLKDGRGNICPVTIILPTLALMAKQKIEKKAIKEERKYSTEEVYEEFMKILDKKIHEAKDTLIERFNHICSQSPNSAKFMYENHTMFGYKPEEGIISALKHGTIVIGQLGLAECLMILFNLDHTCEEGMKYAKEIEGLFSKRCAEFKQGYKLNFGVYYTPAENLCYTAMKNFKKRFKGYEQENVTYFVEKDENGNDVKVDKTYFTNSMHVPVWQKVTPFEKIDIESQLTGYSNAGCITYIELPSTTKHNVEALETIVKYAMEKDIPYFAVNVPVDTCQECGYSDEIDDVCPKCGSRNIKRLRRVTGYLTGDYTSAFNKGKIDETNNRVKHNKTIE